ncbi:flagellar motor switch phosphatase FliY [Bacillaceae bacterium]
MNDKEILSQEEIDALLRQSQGGETDEENPDVNEYLSPMEQDALGEIGNIAFGSAATALSSLLRQKVEITTPHVTMIHKKNLADEFPVPYVVVYVKYTEGFEGTNLLVISQEDASIIADLMMGGDGTSPSQEFTELQLSAVQEAMNQMMGSAATSMSTVFNKFVNISPPGIDILDLKKGDSPHFTDDLIVKVSFRLKIGELIDSTIMQLLPLHFAKSMVESLMGGMAEASSAQEAAVREADRPAATAAGGGQRNAPAAQEQHQGERHADQWREKSAAGATGERVSQTVQEQPLRQKVQPVQFAPLTVGGGRQPAEDRNLDLLYDIPLQVTVELGRTKKLIKEILEMAPGSIIELDKLAGEPVDILVNNKLIAKGEVVVIDENFGVRVTDIISHEDRMQKLQ